MSIAIIGTGWGIRAQIPAFRSAGLEIVALTGRDGDKARRTAQELNIGFATDDWRAVLHRDDVQLVSITTPPHMHHEMVIAALEAGKHILCEKPMALNTDETQAMVVAAAAHEHPFTLIDHELRFLPAVQLARQQIQSGSLGALRFIEARVTGSARRDPNRAWNWWSNAEQGGGVLGAMGSHMIDLIQFLFGPVTAASGLTHTFIRERPSAQGLQPVTADDYSVALLRLASSAISTITLTAVASITEPTRLTAHFEQGVLRIEAGRLFLAEPDGAFRDVTPGDTVDIPEQLRDGEFHRGTIHLGYALKRALAGDRTALAPAATFADGHRIQRILEAVHQSSATQHGWIDIED